MMTGIELNHRILVIDDNPSIHEDFRKILCGETAVNPTLNAAESILFGESPTPSAQIRFELDSAFQGQEGLAKVQESLERQRPYALAFVDVRMPPGWDGMETITQLWNKYPELQVVICTAYSDYSWEEISKQVGQSDNLVILKKPFDNIEVLQLAHALTKKWFLSQQAKDRLQDLDRLVNERTAELQAANEKLQRQIHERAQAEEALRASEERFSKAFQSNPMPMAIQTLKEKRFVDVNDSFLQMSGFGREELLAHTEAELGFWGEQPLPEPLRPAPDKSQPIRNLQMRLRTKTGRWRDLLVFGEVFTLGVEPCQLIIAEDITERVELEGQLRQAQKMEAVGQLAAGVAHDFNNLLTIIQGHASLQLSTARLDLEVANSFKQVLGAAERASTLTRQLLAFSRKQVMQRRALNLNTLIGQWSSMLHRMIGEQIEFQFQFAPDLPPIDGDPCHLEQVLMNLCVNARDAMPQGGRLTIATGAVEVDAEYMSRNAEALPGRFACLSVTDTGCGMDEATQKRIFEPFFTTKEVGKGTGMGLATVYGIVKQHNGWIELESQVGRGATFRIFLPLSASTEVAPEPANETPTQTVGGTETILVVEDEEFLRAFVQTVLLNYGYHIFLARDGLEAKQLWRDHAPEIHLVLTDLVMPSGISGTELAQQFMAEKPELKMIFSSGYSLESVSPDFKLQRGVSFLQKPYQSHILAQAVRHCLDSGNPVGANAGNPQLAGTFQAN